MTGVTLPASMRSFRTSRSSRRSTDDQRSAAADARTVTDMGARSLALEASGPPSAAFAADDHERPARGEGAPQVRQRTPARGVQDQVVAARPVGEVLARVVDDVVGAERPDQVHLRRAADAGDVRAEHLRELHRERAYASGRADDQHRLPRLHLRPCRAGPAGRCGRRSGTAAACSKVRFAGLGASLSARAGTRTRRRRRRRCRTPHLPAEPASRSCRPPRRVPATSLPRMPTFGFRSP